MMFPTICYIKVQPVCSIKEHRLEHYGFLNKDAACYTSGEPSNCKPVFLNWLFLKCFLALNTRTYLGHVKKKIIIDQFKNKNKILTLKFK